MNRVGVILCSQTKKDYECDVRQMYNDSVSFRARRIFMDFVYDKWYVNTSKYGFMEPSFVVEPYDSWYITSTNTRNKATALTEEMIDEWLEKLKHQFPNRDNIQLDCHLSTPYYNRLKTIFPNITYVKQQKVFAKTAWKYYDACWMLLDGYSLRDVFEFLNSKDDAVKRTEIEQWWHHNEHESIFGKSSNISKKYGINDLNLWSVGVGDTLQSCGWTTDKSLLPHIKKTPNGKYRLDSGMAKKNMNMERPDIKPRLDELEEFIGGRKYWHFQNTYDDIMEILDNVWEENNNDDFAKLLIYEDSFSIINKKLPNHNLTDGMLEIITYEWLEKN